MINFMVANRNDKNKRYSDKNIKTLIDAQVENSLKLGWDPSDIVIVSNIGYNTQGVRTVKTELNDFCLTGSKIFGLKWFMEEYGEEDVIWAHDLDCWQNAQFGDVRFDGDVGATFYSRPKFNGGSIFWTLQSKDIIDEVIKRISKDKLAREEPTLNKVFKSDKFKSRIAKIDNSFNVGCSGFVERYERSLKPIRVLHFHPYNRLAWETHALDRNGVGEKAISESLEGTLRKYYPYLATELADPSVREEKRRRRKEKEKQ